MVVDFHLELLDRFEVELDQEKLGPYWIQIVFLGFGCSYYSPDTTVYLNIKK